MGRSAFAAALHWSKHSLDLSFPINCTLSILPLCGSKGISERTGKSFGATLARWPNHENTITLFEAEKGFERNDSIQRNLYLNHFPWVMSGLMQNLLTVTSTSTRTKSYPFHGSGRRQCANSQMSWSRCLDCVSRNFTENKLCWLYNFCLASPIQGAATRSFWPGGGVPLADLERFGIHSNSISKPFWDYADVWGSKCQSFGAQGELRSEMVLNS